MIRSKLLLDRIIVFLNLRYVYQDADYYDITILLCAGDGGYTPVIENYHYIITSMPENQVSRSVITVHTNLFAKKRTLHRDCNHQ